MSLRLRANDGSLAPWSPAAPPRVSVLIVTSAAGPSSAARLHSVSAAVRGALIFDGFQPVDAPDAGADLSLAVAPVSTQEANPRELAARGFTAMDFHYLCLKTHFRQPLAFSWEALSAARGELANLRASVLSLAGVTLEPSSRGVTGYQHRFREYIYKDFDFPESLSCVWDGLRPGALSPGSRAAFLRATLPALGLDVGPTP